MKKVMMLMILLLCLVSCGYSNLYPEQTITSIKYRSVTSFIPNVSERKIDLVNNRVLDRRYIALEENVDYDISFVFDEEAKEIFVKNVIKQGIYHLKKSYFEEGLYDADGWSFEVELSNGEILKTSGYGRFPMILVNINKECIKLFNKDIYDISHSSSLPPIIPISMDFKDDYDNVLSFHSRIRATNYIWNNIEKKDIDNIEFVKGCNKLFWQDFYSSYDVINLDESFEVILKKKNVRFEYLSMKLTSYDLDGNNEIVLEEFMYKDEVIFKLEINKFYILIINFEDGVCQYPFSTILDIERMEKR